MKKTAILLGLLFLILIFLMGSKRLRPEIPTVEEVRAAQIEREMDVTSEEMEEYCLSNGGEYETWKDGKIFCMFKGYGCDPKEFYLGNCGGGF